MDRGKIQLRDSHDLIMDSFMGRAKASHQTTGFIQITEMPTLNCMQLILAQLLLHRPCLDKLMQIQHRTNKTTVNYCAPEKDLHFIVLTKESAYNPNKIDAQIELVCTQVTAVESSGECQDYCNQSH